MPIKSLARGRNFTAGDTSRTVSQRWRAALLDDRLRLTTRGQTVVPGAAKTSNDLDPFATSHDRAPQTAMGQRDRTATPKGCWLLSRPMSRTMVGTCPRH